MQRTRLYASPEYLFVHDAVPASCRRVATRTALLDTSCGRRLTYAEYGELVERCARGLAAAGIRPGEVLPIFLSNCWEYAAAYHAATLAGAVPTLLNLSYREREVRYQLENAEAVALITAPPDCRNQSPQATSAALRQGWYWSGDLARRERDWFYFIVDRLKEMIKYKGFAIASAEVEAVLLEHPAVRNCGVAGKADAVAGEIPVVFVALKPGAAAGARREAELCGYVGERLSHYKQPRAVRFV